MKTMRYFLMLALGAAVTYGAALAAPAWADEQWVSGGFGTDERAELEAKQGYNLMLQFAETGGSYIGDVTVSITGPVTLEAASPGPWFLVRLPAGSYTVTATYGGKAQTMKVDVPATGRKKQAIFW